MNNLFSLYANQIAHWFAVLDNGNANTLMGQAQATAYRPLGTMVGAIFAVSLLVMTLFGVFAFASWLSKRKAVNASSSGDSASIEVLSQKTISDQHQLLLTQIHGKSFLFSVFGEKVELVSGIDKHDASNLTQSLEASVNVPTTSEPQPHASAAPDVAAVESRASKTDSADSLAYESSAMNSDEFSDDLKEENSLNNSWGEGFTEILARSEGASFASFKYGEKESEEDAIDALRLLSLARAPLDFSGDVLGDNAHPNAFATQQSFGYLESDDPNRDFFEEQRALYESYAFENTHLLESKNGDDWHEEDYQNSFDDEAIDAHFLELSESEESAAWGESSRALSVSESEEMHQGFTEDSYPEPQSFAAPLLLGEANPSRFVKQNRYHDWAQDELDENSSYTQDFHRNQTRRANNESLPFRSLNSAQSGTPRAAAASETQGLMRLRDQSRDGYQNR